MWRPLLDGDRAASAAAAVHAPAAALAAPASQWHEPHAFLLSRGDAGLAVCFAYLHEVWPGQGHDERARECLERGVAAAAGPTVNEELFGGFTGVGWAMEHLRGRVLPEDDDGAGDELDEVVLAVLRAGARAPYDLVRGLVGHGVYGLERGARGAGALIVDEVVAHLDAQLHAAPGGGRAIRSDDEFDVGLAHGMAGVVAWLARALVAGHARARTPLADSVRWLLAQRLPPDARAVFPESIDGEGQPRLGRWGWCYGDPGVASALLAAARACRRDDWAQAALAAARHGLATLDQRIAGLADAGFCHGASGLAHMYNRMYQATGDAALGDAASRLADAVLAHGQRGGGPPGHAFVRDDGAGGQAMVPAPALLTGAAGVAAVLAAAVSQVEPAWDRVLLLGT